MGIFQYLIASFFVHRLQLRVKYQVHLVVLRHAKEHEAQRRWQAVRVAVAYEPIHLLLDLHLPFLGLRE